MVSNRRRSENPPKNKLFGCEICKVKTCSEAILRQHLNSKRHMMLVKKQNRCHKKFAAHLNQLIIKLNQVIDQKVQLVGHTLSIDEKNMCSTNEEDLDMVKQKDGRTKYLFGIRIFTYSTQCCPLELYRKTVVNCLNEKIGKLAQQNQVVRETDVEIHIDEQGQCAKVRLPNSEVVAKIIKLGKSEGFYIDRRRLNIKPWYRKEKRLPQHLKREIEWKCRDMKMKKNTTVKQKEGGATEKEKKQIDTSSSVYTNSASKGMLKMLSNCQSVSEQMSRLQYFHQTLADVLTRTQIVCKLTEIFSPYFPGCRITEIGLPALGFGTKDCILDLNLNLGDNPTPADHKCSLPMPSLSGDIRIKIKTKICGKPNITKESLTCLTPEESIIVLYQILHELLDQSHKSLTHTEGIPVVKFKRSEVTCRLYLNNSEAVNCTQVLSMLTQIDDRVFPLIFTVLYWAEQCKKDVFVHVPVSKYAWTMLVVFYLQNIRPPILPPVKPPKKEKHADDWEKYHRNRLQIYKESARKNNQDLKSLLKGFCTYYCDFDFAHKVVCVSTGQAVKSSNISQMDVRDPFSKKNLDHNVIKDTDPVILKQNLSRVTSILQKSVQNTSRSEQPWGLASLLTLPHTLHHTKPSLNVQNMTSSSQTPNVPRSTSEQTTILDCHTSTKYCFHVFVDNHVEIQVRSEKIFQQLRAFTCSQVLSILKEIFYFDIEVKSHDYQMLKLLQGRSNVGNRTVSSTSLDGSNNTSKALDNVSPSNIVFRDTRPVINNNNRDVKPELPGCKTKDVKSELPNDKSPGNIVVRNVRTDVKPWDLKSKLPSCKIEPEDRVLLDGNSPDVKPELSGKKRDDIKSELPDNISKDVKSEFSCNKNEDSTPLLTHKKNVEPGSRGKRNPDSRISLPIIENGNFDTPTDFKEVYIDLTNPSTPDDKTDCDVAHICKELQTSPTFDQNGNSLYEPSNSQTSSLPISNSNLVSTANACPDNTEPPCKKPKLNPDSDKSTLLSLKCTTRYFLWNGRKQTRETLRNFYIKEKGLKRLVDDHAFFEFRLEKEISENIVKTLRNLTQMDSELSFVLGIYIPEQNQARVDFRFSQMKNMYEFRGFYDVFREFVIRRLYKYCEIKQEMYW